jgi:hypothetical protein
MRVPRLVARVRRRREYPRVVTSCIACDPCATPPQPAGCSRLSLGAGKLVQPGCCGRSGCERLAKEQSLPKLKCGLEEHDDV